MAMELGLDEVRQLDMLTILRDSNGERFASDFFRLVEVPPGSNIGIQTTSSFAGDLGISTCEVLFAASDQP